MTGRPGTPRPHGDPSGRRITGDHPGPHALSPPADIAPNPTPRKRFMAASPELTPPETSRTPQSPEIPRDVPEVSEISSPAPDVAVEAPPDLFDTRSTFRDLGLRDSVCKGVEEAGFKHPTDIQAKLIPAILSGRDVIGQARTGTGKTAAFGLPVLHHSDKDTPMQALILTPTRELAAQVAGELEMLGQFTPIRTTCIIGGESMRAQKKSVERGGHLLVGTPGRIMDLHGRGEIRFDRVRFVVLDEVDRMLDIGFREDIRKILKNTPNHRQTIFVSATISDDIERLARSYMKPDAEKITTVAGSLTVELVDQKYLTVEPWDKRTLLLHLLRHEKPDTTVVFCKTKATVHKVTQYLRDKGLGVREIHGDLDQKKRNRVMESLREGKLNVLIASDLAARGLDVEHITHVINYDLPEDPEVYIHRIGRTARAGRRGVAWTFVTPDEGQRLTDVEKLTGALIEKMDYPGFEPGPVPQDVRELRERDAQRLARSEQPKDRTAPSVPPPDQISDEERARLFPGGVVPKGPPPRRTLGARFKTRRSR
jgi:superfamily II DNA/RNA helicase